MVNIALDGTTARNSGTPYRTDLVLVDATYTISGTGDTFQEARALTWIHLQCYKS